MRGERLIACIYAECIHIVATTDNGVVILHPDLGRWDWPWRLIGPARTNHFQKRKHSEGASRDGKRRLFALA